MGLNKPDILPSFSKKVWLGIYHTWIQPSDLIPGQWPDITWYQKSTWYCRLFFWLANSKFKRYGLYIRMRLASLWLYMQFILFRSKYPLILSFFIVFTNCSWLPNDSVQPCRLWWGKVIQESHAFLGFSQISQISASPWPFNHWEGARPSAYSVSASNTLWIS